MPPPEFIRMDWDCSSPARFAAGMIFMITLLIFGAPR